MGVGLEGAMRTTKERPSPSPLPRKGGMEREAISNATLVEPPKRSGTVKPRTTHLVRVRGRGRVRVRVSEDHPPAVPLDQVDLGRQAGAREQHQRHLVRVRVTVRVRARVGLGTRTRTRMG